MNPSDRIKDLVRILNQYNHEYYVLDNPTVDDFTYDRLMDELIHLENQHPDLVLDNSPTKRVGGTVLEAFRKVPHAYPMLSLGDVFNHDELLAFDKRVENILKTREYSYLCEMKIDGLGISLRYQNGVLKEALTRGDGVIGEDVYHNIITIKSIPLKIKEQRAFEVRGECFMPKKVLETLNHERATNGMPLFANTRNAAAGSIRNLDSGITAKRSLDAFWYYIPNASALGLESQEAALDFLKTQGFKVSDERRHVKNIEAVIAYIDDYSTKRKKLPYDVDGAVIKVNEFDRYELLGSTTKTPRWAIAYKYPPEETITRLINIIYTVGRTGRIAPNAVLEPARISGTLVSRATLHNEEYIIEKDIRVGDYVYLRKAGEIIPEVMKVDLTKRAHQAPPTVFITHCPVCGSELIKVEALHYCPNKNCKAKVIEAIIHFASRSAMDIDGLGEKIVETFYNEKLIKDVSDLYQLETKKAEILLLEGWQEKSYQNLITALEASKDKSLESLLFGLGIKEVGSKTAKVLALAFEDLDRLMIASEEELFNIKDIGTTTVKALHDYFLDQENVKLIMRLKEAGLNMKYLGPKVVTDSFFSGKTVVITGTLEHYSRESLSNILENLGAKVSSAVSKHTDFLIVGSEAGSKLSKAKTLGTRIILEPELREILAE